MPVVRAGPSQFLLVGHDGAMENRGAAVQAFLRPGTVYVVVPATKQEATFEFTQETKDGIPLRFKGILVYRVTDPVAAARQFDFGSGAAVGQITALLTHVCLGELRHAVSHMTMAECIEQRKTALTSVVEAAIASTIHGPGGDWGITVEVAQVAQVFIVDADLRQQLEAGVRNEIRLASDQSTIRTKEAVRLAEMASASRVDEHALADDRDTLRRRQERFRAEMAAEEDRLNTEAPVRVLQNARERELAREEIETRVLQNRVKALDVEQEMLLPRAQQELRREILPLEQAPRVVEAASRVLNGTNLTVYGEGAELLGQLAPLFELLGTAVRQAAHGEAAHGEGDRSGVEGSGT